MYVSTSYGKGCSKHCREGLTKEKRGFGGTFKRRDEFQTCKINLGEVC